MSTTDFSHSQPTRWALLGASRGLGRAVAEHLLDAAGPKDEILLAARKRDRLENFRVSAARTQVEIWDFANSQDQDGCLQTLSQYDPHRLIYFAGGGPYGPYGQKEWKDHNWAFQVSFVQPARLLHWALTAPKARSLQQLTLLGSAIAEVQAEPLAASYNAAKQALAALLNAVWAENPPVDVRLFSPGYMDTEMLPPGAKVRYDGQSIILDPHLVAEKLLRWLQEPAPLHLRFMGD